MATTIREVEFTDAQAVSGLMSSVGWSCSGGEQWERLWLRNPASENYPSRLSKGWVIEDAGRIGGFLCNVEQQYQFGDRCLRAAVAASLVVAPEFRGDSLRLVLAYAQQKGVDLLLNTTAAPETTKIFEFLKFKPIPQPDYDRSLFWILRSGAFVSAALRKKGWPWAVGGLAGLCAAPAVASGIRLLGRYPRPSMNGSALKTIAAEEIDSDFDALWRRKLTEGPKLLACRTSRTLRWHFSGWNATNPPFLTCAYRGSRLVGYLAMVRQDAHHIALRRARIADLFVEGDDAETIEQLVGTAVQEACRRGADMVEMVGLPESVRRAARVHRPFTFQHQNCPFLFKASSADLQGAFGSSAVWHACLYDGDGSL